MFYFAVIRLHIHFSKARSAMREKLMVSSKDRSQESSSYQVENGNFGIELESSNPNIDIKSNSSQVTQKMIVRKS